MLKHSGEIEKTVYKWQYDKLWTTDIINYIAYKLITDQFSDKFIKNLQLEFSRLTDENGKPLFLPEMLECELKRLLRRACNEPKKGRTQEQYDKETGIQKLTEDLMLIYNAQDKHSSFSNFLSFLSISDFIARHTKTQAEKND